MKSALESRIIKLRHSCGLAVRVSVPIEALTSFGTLIVKAGDWNRTSESRVCQTSLLATSAHRHAKTKRVASRVCRPSFAALFVFFISTLAIIANLRYNVKPILLAISQNCDTMNLWKIKGFIDRSGENIVKQWCDAKDDDIWNAFVAHLTFLSGQMPDMWVRPWVGKLGGGRRGRKTGCAGLIELRFDVGNVEYRPLGYFSGKMEFTILFFAEERGGDFDPPNACQTAKERKAFIDTNKERAREFRL